MFYLVRGTVKGRGKMWWENFKKRRKLGKILKKLKHYLKMLIILKWTLIVKVLYEWHFDNKVTRFT